MAASHLAKLIQVGEQYYSLTGNRLFQTNGGTVYTFNDNLTRKGHAAALVKAREMLAAITVEVGRQPRYNSRDYVAMNDGVKGKQTATGFNRATENRRFF